MKIKFGAIVTDGRGKIGGHVASKNRSGAYLRTKVTPSNPNTSYQAQARGILASLSQGWAGLTNAERLAWNSAVADWGATDIFGDIKNPTGLNLYVKLNANLLGIGSTTLDLPPAKQSTPTAYIVSATYSLATSTLSIVLSDSSAGTSSALVRATPSLSQGVTFVKSQLRVIESTDVTGSSVTVVGAYEDKFGTPSIGDNVVVSIQFVNGSGQKSVASQVRATITT